MLKNVIMGAKKLKVCQLVSGWEAVELVLQCVFLGIWQFLQISVKRLWKGYRRKSPKSSPPVELTVDSSVGTHCYIIIKGVKYHYVETGSKSGQIVLILGDAPDKGKLWGPNWCRVVQRLAETNHHVITLDLRGTGGSEGGSRSDLSPPRAVEELSSLMSALGVTDHKPAIVIGFGIGGMLTWYLAHSRGSMISKFIVIGAPHPNLYWQYPPAAFCNGSLHFLQWPYFPERWLAEGQQQGGGGGGASSRACDWSGALNYIRGAAWWRINPEHRVSPPCLLVGGGEQSASQLLLSAQLCRSATPRVVASTDPNDAGLPNVVLEFLLVKEKADVEESRGLVGRMLGAVADRGRELTARLVLPHTQA